MPIASVQSSGTGADVNAPPRFEGPKTKAECEQTCNGKWGEFGMRRRVTCLCRTKDNGKDCRDKNDCEGQCFLDEVRSEVVEPGPPARGYFIGRCSEFMRFAGCKRLIAAGTKARGPVELAQLPSPLCVD